MTHFKLFLILALSVVSDLCLAQNVVTDSTATVVSYWRKGEVAKYSLTLKKEKYKDSQLISNGSSTSAIEITVVDATDKSYILNWKCTAIKLNNNEIKDPFFQKLLTLTEGINFKYKTSELGEFQELLNWVEVKNSVYAIIDNLGKQFKNDVVETALAETKKLFNSKESIEQVILKDVQLLHTLYGGEYTFKQKVQANTELPNFFGGDPFPAILTIEMTELNKGKNTCRIHMSQSLHKTKLTKELSKWMEKMGKPPDSKLPEIYMEDNYDFQVELIKGWMSKAISIRIAETDDLKNVETHELKKIN
jgi:hypothetical protein